MPATQTRLAYRGVGSKKKTTADILRFRKFLFSLRSDPIIAVFYLFHVTTFYQFRKSHRCILSRYTEILCNNRRALDGQLIRIAKSTKDAVVCLIHPLRQVPDLHGYATILQPTISECAYLDDTANSLYGIVSSFLCLAQRGVANGSPGVLGKAKSPGRAFGRSDPVVVPRPCQTRTRRLLKAAKDLSPVSMRETSSLAVSTTQPFATPWRSPMSCERCGSQCHGRRCSSCEQIASAEDQIADTETFACPKCGASTSGEGVVCYRCRGESDD